MNDRFTEFFRQASFYRYHPKFEEFERLYKIRLENAFSESRDLLKSDPKNALRLFRRALQSKDNNIIDWRDSPHILNWLKADPNGLVRSLDRLWNEKLSLSERFSSFCEALTQVGVSQAGGQLAVTSTLLMSLSALKFPPVKTDSFRRAMSLAGWEPFTRRDTPAYRYEQALAFLDALVERSADFGVEIRDRLDAQGVVWCVSGGWPKLPLPPNWVNDPQERLRQQKSEFATELIELETEPKTSQLTDTQKLMLVKARRGQSWFREQLVKFFNCCAVTGCGELCFLRASHIKPWKDADNSERLDPFNGLLLSPNLDAAFDNGFISFNDDGHILISKALEPAERKLLGIHSKLSLRKISPNHRPYLTYHRDHVLKKNE